MKYSDFSAQQSALHQEYNFEARQQALYQQYGYEPPLSAQAQLQQEAMKYAQKSYQFTQKAVTTTVNTVARTTGALARLVTNPTDPASYTSFLATAAEGIGDTASLVGEAYTTYHGENVLTNTYRDAFNAVDSLAQNAAEGLNHASMELELSNDPISALLRQFDPVRMVKNSVMNTELAAQVHGKGRGYMMEAQVINALKQPVAIAGSMLVTAGVGAGATGVGSVPGAIVAAVGAALITLSNSTHVDVKTGERSVKMTDQAAIQSAISILTAVIGGAVAGPAADVGSGTFMAGMEAQLAMSTSMSLGKQMGMNAATSYLGGMVKYDAKGQSRGLHAVDSDEGKLAAMGAITAAGMAAWGGSDTKAGLMKGMQSPGMSPFAQGFSDHILGAVEGALVENVGHAALGRYDLLDAKRQTDLSAGLGLLGAAAMGGARAQMAARGKATLWARAREAQRNDNQNQAESILRGIGYRRKEDLDEAIGQINAQLNYEKKGIPGHELLRLYQAKKQALTGEKSTQDDYLKALALVAKEGGKQAKFSLQDLDRMLSTNKVDLSGSMDTAAFQSAYKEHSAYGAAIDAEVRQGIRDQYGNMIPVENNTAPMSAEAMWGKFFEQLDRNENKTRLTYSFGGTMNMIGDIAGDGWNNLFGSDRQVTVDLDSPTETVGAGGENPNANDHIYSEFGTDNSIVDTYSPAARKAKLAETQARGIKGTVFEFFEKRIQDIALQEFKNFWAPHDQDGLQEANDMWLKANKKPKYMSQEYLEAKMLQWYAGDNQVAFYKGRAMELGYNWNDEGINIVGLRDASTRANQRTHDDQFLVIQNNEAIGLFYGSTDPGKNYHSQSPSTGTAQVPNGNYSFWYDSRTGSKNNNILRPNKQILVNRDANRNGFIDGAERNRLYSSAKTIYFHSGGGSFGNVGNYSIGCQVIGGHVGYDIKNNQPLVSPYVNYNVGSSQGTYNDFLEMVKPGGNNINYMLMNQNEAPNRFRDYNRGLYDRSFAEGQNRGYW